MKNRIVGAFIAWIGTFLPMLAFNTLFHSVLMAKFFDEQLGGLTIPVGEPNVMWVVLADLMISAAFVYFALGQKRGPGDLRQNIRNGAVICLLASGTWNFMNMALMNGWPMNLMLVDMTWHFGLGAVCGLFTGACFLKFGTPKASSPAETQIRKAG